MPPNTGGPAASEDVDAPLPQAASTVMAATLSADAASRCRKRLVVKEICPLETCLKTCRDGEVVVQKPTTRAGDRHPFGSG